MKVILGLGSNIGDQVKYIEQAITLLQDGPVLTDIQISKIYKSKAVLPSGAPDDWDKSYLNLAVSGDCELEPQELLEKVKEIEKIIGRIDRGFWSPREIDIDILLYGDYDIASRNLTIPHKFLLERDFALLPVNDLAPNWIYPRSGIFHNQTISEIIKRNPIDKSGCAITDILVTI
ncbi:MAG: 2-amino-4-hydroxy-6-hydroxymethyldihydropteridine diphosphokinase [Rickettsiales bacterium]|nr:2-amino-4-hydroxy-6-hydroxymethyldihydropteridine diphosphokinase [Rickettsiales bacterium]